jgi:Na+-driven multidrug efflux pump/anti-sigma regulatory factor (Ser/Thr protein kinase)
LDNSVLIKRAYNKCLIFSMLMIIPASLASIIDSIFIGSLVGPVGTAAYGLIMPTSIIINAISLLLGNGGITLYLDHVGKGEKEQANRNFTAVVLIGFVLSVILAALGFTGSDAIVAGLGAKGDKAYLLNDGSAYMKGIMLSVIPNMVCGVMDRYIRMDGDDSIVLFGTLGMGVSNAVLDYVLGKACGMWGIGLATFICYLIYLGIMCLHFLKKSNNLFFVRPAGWVHEIREAAKSGSSSAMMRVCQAVGMMIGNTIILSYGAENLAGATIRNCVAALFIFLSMGIEMATMLLAGMFYGERDKNELVKLMKKSVLTEIVLMLILSAAVFFFARPFAAIFTHDGGILEISVVALKWYAVSLPLSILAETLQYIYQGIHNNFMANFISIMKNLVLYVISIVVMTKMIGVTGYWASSLTVAAALLILIVVCVFVHNGSFPKTGSGWLMLKPDFEENFQAVWSFSIRDNAGDVVKISRELQHFCEENGVDKKRAFKLALAAEEMAGNIVQHAFKKGGMNCVDMCAQIKKNGEVSLRIRDNGRSFNPVSYVNHKKDDDITADIGIKMTQKITKAMDYRFIGGLNNLLITV